MSESDLGTLKTEATKDNVLRALGLAELLTNFRHADAPKIAELSAAVQKRAGTEAYPSDATSLQTAINALKALNLDITKIQELHDNVEAVENPVGPGE